MYGLQTSSVIVERLKSIRLIKVLKEDIKEEEYIRLLLIDRNKLLRRKIGKPDGDPFSKKEDYKVILKMACFRQHWLIK